MSDEVAADAGPFTRAAAATRAVAVILAIPPCLVLYEIVMDRISFGPSSGLVRDLGVVAVLSGPATVLAIATVYVRRARTWAILTGIVFLALLILFGLMVLVGLSAAMMVEYRNWWRGSAMNLRKFAVLWAAAATLLAAVGVGLRDLLRADSVRRVVERTHGFEVKIIDRPTP